MAHVQVTIAGRAYRMACGDGEEAHLLGLAERFDAKIADMRTAFGEIGEMRLHVMAALTLADDVADGTSRVAVLEADVQALRAEVSGAAERGREAERTAAEAVSRLAERIERLARDIALPPEPGRR